MLLTLAVLCLAVVATAGYEVEKNPPGYGSKSSICVYFKSELLYIETDSFISGARHSCVGMVSIAFVTKSIDLLLIHM